MCIRDRYNIPANEVKTSSVIASLAGKAIKWDCYEAQDLAYSVLEDVNEHTLAKNFRELADNHNATFDMEEA